MSNCPERRVFLRRDSKGPEKDDTSTNTSALGIRAMPVPTVSSLTVACQFTGCRKSAPYMPKIMPAVAAQAIDTELCSKVLRPRRKKATRVKEAALAAWLAGMGRSPNLQRGRSTSEESREVFPMPPLEICASRLSCVSAASRSLKELHGTLVLFGPCSGCESAEVPALAGSRVLLA